MVDRTCLGPWSGSAMASVSVFALWIAILLIAYHVAGLTVGAFYPGLVLGSAVLVVLGACLRLTTSAARPLPTLKLPNSLLLVTAGGVLALIPCVITYDFHDKAYAAMGHLSFTNNILNGFYPPLDLHNPRQTLHYHYGVDLAAALISVTAGIAADYAFDLLTLVLWAYVLVLVGVLGENIIGAGRGWVAALIACFGGGVPWIADADPVLGKKLVLLPDKRRCH